MALELSAAKDENEMNAHSATPRLPSLWGCQMCLYVCACLHQQNECVNRRCESRCCVLSVDYRQFVKRWKSNFQFRKPFINLVKTNGSRKIFIFYNVNKRVCVYVYFITYIHVYICTYVYIWICTQLIKLKNLLHIGHLWKNERISAIQSFYNFSLCHFYISFRLFWRYVWHILKCTIYIQIYRHKYVYLWKYWRWEKLLSLVESENLWLLIAYCLFFFFYFPFLACVPIR